MKPYYEDDHVTLTVEDAARLREDAEWLRDFSPVSYRRLRAVAEALLAFLDAAEKSGGGEAAVAADSPASRRDEPTSPSSPVNQFSECRVGGQGFLDVELVCGLPAGHLGWHADSLSGARFETTATRALIRETADNARPSRLAP